MKTKTVAFALMAVTAGVLAWARPHDHRPADFRDAVADSDRFDTSIPVFAKDSGNIPEPKAAVVEGVNKQNPYDGAYFTRIQWVTIPGGRFMTGNDDKYDSRPKPAVTVKDFDMTKTVVTVEQYAECVRNNQCTKPGTGGLCNWAVPGREQHPVNCVKWAQANQYAKFAGGRLPSEEEWEYAAKSGGKDQAYPWGNTEPNCTLAVMKGNGGPGCANNGTMPVCSKPDGNTAQGLCDMAGNVTQWTQDRHTPGDITEPILAVLNVMVLRGGSFFHDDARNLRADIRYGLGAGGRRAYIGFRLVR